jgi:hypothetical protein
MLRSFAPIVASIMLCGCALTADAPEAIHQCNAKYQTDPPSGDVNPKALTPIRLGSEVRKFSSGVYACLRVAVDERGDVSGLTVPESNNDGFADYFSRIVVRTKFEPGKSNGTATAGRLIISSAVH